MGQHRKSNQLLRNDAKEKESGFTLIEIIIVIIISGLILTTLINAYLTWSYILKSSKTRETIEIISDAMSAYASRNFRIPCPANPSNAGPEPFGTEIGSGANGSQIGSCDNVATGETEGIIPFVSLGLDASIAVDGWGNYITYQVSPAFTRDPEDDTILVHAKCRTTEWIEGVFRLSSGVLDGGRNISPRKARFCCMQPQGTETEIFATSAADTPPNLPAIVFNEDSANWYDEADVVADPNFDDPTNPIAEDNPQEFYNNSLYGGGFVYNAALETVSGHTDVPVYAVISHGSNGAGAFVVNGTMNRITSYNSVSETINAESDNQIVYDIEHDNSSNNTYYDDIVSWQTQSSLMARLRRDSCAVP